MIPDIDISPHHWKIVRDILQKYIPSISNSQVWVFGSRANKTAKPYSDLDLAIISSHPINLNTLAALTTAFVESDLPWKVDILDWASTSTEFQAIVGKNKIIIYPEFYPATPQAAPHPQPFRIEPPPLLDPSHIPSAHSN